MKRLLVIGFLLSISSSVYANENCHYETVNRYTDEGDWFGSNEVLVCPDVVRADGLSGRNDSASFGLDDLVRTSIEGMFDSACGDYCITGICAHLRLGFSWSRGPYLYTIISPRIRSTVPDLLVASYNHTGEHPFDIWQSTVEEVIKAGNESIIASLLGAGDGLQGGRGNPRQQDRHQSLSFKEVSIIGHPASILPAIVRTDGTIGDMPPLEYRLPTIGSLTSDNLATMYQDARTAVTDIYNEARSGIDDLLAGGSDDSGDSEGGGFNLAETYAGIQTRVSESFTNFTTQIADTYQNAINEARTTYQQARTEIGEFSASEAYENALSDARNTFDDVSGQVSDAYTEIRTQVTDAYNTVRSTLEGGEDAPPEENIAENNPQETEPDTPSAGLDFADLYDSALARIKQEIEDTLTTAIAGLEAVQTVESIKREVEKIQELAEFYDTAMTVVEGGWRSTIFGNMISPRFRAPRIFCPTNTVPLQPYYLSYVDSFFWRSGFPITDGPISGSNHSSTILNPFSNDTLKPDPDRAEVWGHMYPREGTVNSNHDAKVATVAAWRAMDVLNNNVKEGAGGTRFGVALPTGDQFDQDLKWEKRNQGRWQMIYPEVKSCQASPAYNVTSLTRDFIEINSYGSYAWNYYNTFSCCSNSRGHYIGSINLPTGPICL